MRAGDRARVPAAWAPPRGSSGTASDRGEAHLRDRPEPGQSVACEADFFALGKGARCVINWDLDGDISFAHQLHDQLDIKIKTIAVKVDTKQRVTAENLEHRSEEHTSELQS